MIVIAGAVARAKAEAAAEAAAARAEARAGDGAAARFFDGDAIFTSTVLVEVALMHRCGADGTVDSGVAVVAATAATTLTAATAAARGVRTFNGASNL